MKTVPQYNFEHDLALSKKSVDRVKHYLEAIGCTDIKENDDSAYDVSFVLKNKTRTIEVKEDFMYHITGNVAIEYYSRDKDSGVTSSKADIWCYVLDRGIGYDGIYFVSLAKLRKYLQENKFPEKDGGDNLTSKLYLLPITSFIKIFERKTK
jgi:hypothetical protein